MLRTKLPLLFSSTFDFLPKCTTCLSGHNLSASYSRTHEVRLSNQKNFKHSSPLVNNAISISVSNMQPSAHFTEDSCECGSTQTEKLLKTSQDFWGEPRTLLYHDCTVRQDWALCIVVLVQNCRNFPWAGKIIQLNILMQRALVVYSVWRTKHLLFHLILITCEALSTSISSATDSIVLQ